MRAEFSEFSYGFAVTREYTLEPGGGDTVPIFPSLVEEGRGGGGYDVMLEQVLAHPGVPLFLQFKRPEALTRRSAKELDPDRDGGPLDLALPYFRIPLMPARHSPQHALLLQHEAEGNEVRYVAPRFHEMNDFRDAYVTGNVRNRSILIKPSDIGPLPDGDDHHIVYDQVNHYFCSDTRKIKAETYDTFSSSMRQRVNTEERSFREGRLDDISNSFSELIRKFDLERIPEDRPGRRGRPERVQRLVDIADMAMAYFDAQFFVVTRPGVLDIPVD